MPHTPDPDVDLMTTSQVADLFKVDVRTVTRWSKKGLIPTRWTIGGHRRYPADEVKALLTQRPEPQR